MITTLILLSILAKWPGLLKAEKWKSGFQRYSKKIYGLTFLTQRNNGKE